VAAGEELTPVLLGRLAGAGDEVARGVLLEAARWLGIGIVSLMHAIDPAAVVIGGAMTFGGEADPVGKMFIDRVRREVRERAFPVLAARTPIRYATLGGDAGAIGAAGLARLDHRRG
jgi:glucokinase